MKVQSKSETISWLLRSQMLRIGGYYAFGDFHRLRVRPNTARPHCGFHVQVFDILESRYTR